MAKYWGICVKQTPCIITVLLLSCIIPITFQYGSLAKQVTFDYDCSQIECATNTDSCPPDSIESEPAPAFDVLYGPEELMPRHDFYDEVDDLGDAVEQHFEELPMELNDVTALPVAANSTLGQLSDDRATKDLETEKGPELVLVKRQLRFDNGPTEAIDEHERMLQICCPTMTLESLQRRRRRRYSSVEDCKCKPCRELPQCANDEVAVRVHEAKGVPGDCCPTYVCAPKKECSDGDVQPYWRDACTRCSCHGENGPELCHNECPMNEMGEIETQRSCYASDSNEPMMHGSDWYENNWCTKCHCENGERECVGSLCMPTTCSNPVKIHGQCCPQCPVGVENILIAHENSTDTSKSSQAEKELQSESTSTTTVATILDNSTTKGSPELPALATSTLTSLETSSESSTVLIAIQKQSASSEEKTELAHPSSTTTDVSTTSTDVSASTTESTTTTRSIDDIASESYFGPVVHTSTEESSTSTHEILEQTGENTTQSVLEPQADISTSTSSSNSESTSTVEPTPTPAFVSSTSETVSTETSTYEASSSKENIKEFSTTSVSMADNSSTTVAASYKEITTSTETSQETPLAIDNAESTTTTNFKPTESTTTELDSISSTTGISSTTSADSTTTISTTPLISVETSSTHLYSLSTSSPLPSTASPQTSTTFTTNSPYSSTAATQTVSTVISWYTFSTSAPSPPIPQPTVYQPSVRQFFTRPEVRYIGATVFVAFTVICALAVWKFCMPSRSERLKNHYRTVPSSEATSLSHISSTSHSSMA
ncbi:uncharacterized protein LOC126763090 isoform X2 [Bactrocera neohumeralis]|nr:uncharacterized protein LOC126763090 isoform X2 [Bactrocera neohumeralis]XP_050336249.1 uncharacterized protein LOC126763090 isoform X2 [Bactrocera neohumeralis]